MTMMDFTPFSRSSIGFVHSDARLVGIPLLQIILRLRDVFLGQLEQ
jgi:hypothetical protein